MKVAEVVRLGTGLPSIFNDETYIMASDESRISDGGCL